MKLKDILQLKFSRGLRPIEEMKQLRDKERDRKTETEAERQERKIERQRKCFPCFFSVSALENAFTVLIMRFLIHVI